MPLETLPAEDAILAKLKTELPHVYVDRGTYLEDSVIPKSDEDGMFQPYVLVAFGGNYAYGGDSSIIGPRWDTQRATLTMYIVAPTDRVATQIKDKIRAALLTDFRMPDAGAMRVNTGYSFVDTDLGYNRYVQVIGFAYLFNLS